ncbi:hypothetical protein EC973_009266, partial [Apophysomyces ossiformis]
MQDILTYDTTADKWDLIKSQGAVTPSERNLHTTNWSNTTNINGPDVFRAVSDYCYTYDTVSNQWTQHDPQGQPGAGVLYGHS